MKLLQVALLQMVPTDWDLAANQAKGTEYCRRARAVGADVALFPEMWSIGYPGVIPNGGTAPDLLRAPERWGPDQPAPPAIPPEAVARWEAAAIARDHPFVEHFRALAQELEMAIAVTYLERWPGGPRNTVSLIDRHGDLVLTYAKVHTCAWDATEGLCTPGDGFYVCTLDTAVGPVEVGAMICYDREFPESARVLMLKGAELILTPNACELEANRLGQFRVRAVENMVALAMANYAAPANNGHSVAHHPVAFGQGERPRDTLVIEAGEREGVYLASFDLDEIRDYRSRETWGNAFRRPQHYAELVSEEVRPPFVRVDAQGRRFDRAGR